MQPRATRWSFFFCWWKHFRK